MADDEWDTLSTALNRYGIIHVAPGRERHAELPAAPADLFERLALATDPRLQQAAVFLLLTHPELAGAAQAAIARLAGTARDRATRRYVAAAALQRMARTRLELALGAQPLIPPAYLRELGVPPLEEDFGEATLWELARQEEAPYGYNAWGTYRALLDLFLAEIRKRSWGNRSAAAR